MNELLPTHLSVVVSLARTIELSQFDVRTFVVETGWFLPRPKTKTLPLGFLQLPWFAYLLYGFAVPQRIDRTKDEWDW